jgi:hypothetical protein
MNLQYRNFRLTDAASCVRLLAIYPEYTPDILAQLPIFWKRLLGDQAIITATIEEREPGRRPRIVAFSATVFVTEVFMQEARLGREPYLVRRLIERELRGRASPILRRNAIARANAGEGLNTIILHAAPKTAEHGEPGYAYRFYLKEAIVWSHRGYRIREGLQEVWSEIDLEWVRAYQSLRSDYSDYYQSTGGPIPNPRPYLYGVTAEEALKNASSLAAPVFLYTPPRFYFSHGAQDMLARALDGETDSALANSLHVSLAAVKMRWRQIYDRVEEIAPELIPEPAGRLSEASRGKEKRRYIIEYVRNHPEELRPFLPSHEPRRSAGELGRLRVLRS